jgi:anti-sigma factor RsiW
VSNCDQFREMYEAYALGALDVPERDTFEAHLATGCAQCAKSVAEARWLVSQLAYTSPAT